MASLQLGALWVFRASLVRMLVHGPADTHMPLCVYSSFVFLRSTLFRAGLAINFFGNATRREISATSFTVLGCMNKLLAVLVDVLLTKSSTLAGTSCLVFCIFGGLGYSLSIDAEKKSAPKDDVASKTEAGDTTDSSDSATNIVSSYLLAHKYKYGTLLAVFLLAPLLFIMRPHYDQASPLSDVFTAAVE
jgi:hypothetical protein